MNREDKRQIGRIIKKRSDAMSDAQVYDYVNGIVQAYSRDLMDKALNVLNQEFGFGPIRKERFMKAMFGGGEDADGR